MVADLCCFVDPSVDVNVLILGVLLQRVGDEHMVELLSLHVEQVGVPLDRLDIGHCVEVVETRDLNIALQGRHCDEFVEVASGNDTGVLVLGKDAL